MFHSTGALVRALERSLDRLDPETSSVLKIGSGPDPHRDPFGRGFLTYFEERAELRARLARLDERSRRLLLLWYVERAPAPEIARTLGVSRVHCYRLRSQALRGLLDDAKGSGVQAVAVAHA